MESLRHHRRRCEPGHELSRRVQRHRAKLGHRRPDQDARRQEQQGRAGQVSKRTESTAAILAPGERWAVSGALTMDSAAQVLAASRGAPLPASGVISLARVDRVDSAGVAVLLAWKRRAAAEGKALSFAEIPGSLAALSELYGVVDVLAPGAGRSPAPVA